MFVSPLIHLPALTSCLRASPNGRQGRTFLTGSVSCPLPHAPSQDDYILVTAEPPAPAPPPVLVTISAAPAPRPPKGSVSVPPGEDRRGQAPHAALVGQSPRVQGLGVPSWEGRGEMWALKGVAPLPPAYLAGTMRR